MFSCHWPFFSMPFQPPALHRRGRSGKATPGFPLRSSASSAVSFLLSPSSQQVSQNSMGGIIQCLQVPDLIVFLKNQAGKLLEETLRISSPDDQCIAFADIHTRYIRHRQESSCQGARLIARDEDRERVFIEEITNPGQGA